jgi:glutamate synthase (NADPH/NADH) small chain
MAIKALGQNPVLELLAGIDGVQIGRKGVVVEKDGATTRPGLYAGGDCISKGAEIVNAVQEGKVAARSIDQYLSRKG